MPPSFLIEGSVTYVVGSVAEEPADRSCGHSTSSDRGKGVTIIIEKYPT